MIKKDLSGKKKKDWIGKNSKLFYFGPTIMTFDTKNIESDFLLRHMIILTNSLCEDERVMVFTGPLSYLI